MVDRFLVPIRRHKDVSHLLSCLRSHQKRNAQVGRTSGTKNVNNASDICVQFPPEKMEKSANQQAPIPHFGKSGTP